MYVIIVPELELTILRTTYICTYSIHPITYVLIRVPTIQLVLKFLYIICTCSSYSGRLGTYQASLS